MAVQIPVIIDIDQAFKDAANRVGNAIKPMQKAVDEESLEVIVEINKKGDLAEVLDFVGKTKLSMDNLKYAIKSVNQQLEQMKAREGSLDFSQGEAKALLEARVILQDILEQRKGLSKEIDKSIKLIEQETEAERQHQAALNANVNTIAGLNTKLAALTEDLSNTSFGSSTWAPLAKQIEQISVQMAKVNAYMKEFGANSGSIDQLTARIRRLNVEWESMSAAKKFDSNGTLTADAKRIYESYKKAAGELKTQGITLEQLLQKEQRRNQLIAQGQQKRKYENAILSSTAKTMAVLQEKERILSDRLSRAAFGTSKYEKLKTDLQGVRREMEEINRDLSGESADIDVLLGKADNKMANLVKNSARLVALHSATSFIRNVREVTSEFEMQRVALGGIIQDTAEAEALFKRIKAAAIQSPFEIKDLVTFTKQLSAYRIETDKLFDVTMQLADVSAGLGVDMGRLTLAYGQVRAAAVLRGQELRQFTEAGIPLVELLADKFTELNNRTVTTAEVFDLISKRAVSFSMIEEIFDDMTSAGGMFYKMQEKQSETLLGQWMKLKDALSIMYDEIGNTTVVHGAMEKLMADAMNLMQNWRQIAGVLKAVGIEFLAVKASSLFVADFTRRTQLAKKAQVEFKRAATASKLALETGITAYEKQAVKIKKVADLLKKASNATTGFGQIWYRLRASMANGGWISIAITAVTSLIGYLVSAQKEAQRLGKALVENISKGDLQIQQSERNFKRLADAAVMAADGSAEQREALKELQRTYGDVIPSQDLQIAKLKELKGNYESLTDAIREKIEMQIHEQNVNEITETFGTSLGTQRKGLEKFLKKEAGYSTEEATRVIEGVNDAIKKGLLTAETDFFDAAKIIENIIEEQIGEKAKPGIGQAFQQASGFFKARSYYEKLLKDTQNYNVAIEDEEARFGELNNTMGVYADRLKQIREDLKNAPEGFTLEDVGKFEFNDARWKQAIARYKEELTSAIDADISQAFANPDSIDFSVILDKLSMFDKEADGKLKSFVQAIQKDYEKIAPQDATTRLVSEAAQRFAKEIGISMSSVQGYLKQDETSMKDYADAIEDFVKEQKSRIAELQFLRVNFRAGISDYTQPTQDEITAEQKQLDFLEKMEAFIKSFASGKTSGKNPVLEALKEELKDVQEIYKRYKEFVEYMDKSKAEKEIERIYGKVTDIDFLSPAEYKKRLSEILSKIKAAKGDAADIADAERIVQDVDWDELKTELEDRIKKVSDEIKRSETARDFYNNILEITGDQELAATMSISVYGGIGEEFQQRLQKQLNEALASLEPEDISDELKSAFAGRDFDVILANLDKFPEKWQDILKKMAEDSQKFDADRVKDLLKALEKAKSYGEQRVKIAEESAKRMQIIEEMDAPDSEKSKLKVQLAKKESEDIAKLEYEAFKDTPMYIELFDNLDSASVQMLTNMRESLVAMKSQWKDLAPSELKELQSRINELDEQLANRNPFKALKESIAEYRRMSAIPRSEADMNVTTANDKLIAERQVLDELTKQYKEKVRQYPIDSAEVKAAKDAMDAQAEKVNVAKDEAEVAQKIATDYDQAKENIKKAAAALQDWIGTTNTIIDKSKELVDTFASDDFSETFSIVADGAVKTLTGVGETASGVAKLMTGDIAGGVMDLVSSLSDLVVGIGGTAKKLDIKQINRQIEDQAKKVENLEYEYSRLSAAMDKAFGNDYVYDYNKQRDVLQAKIEAYNRQAELEESKGKKADKQKAQDYRDQARDVADEIVELKDQASSFFAGSDLASAAESFADAWLSAYQEFGDTSTAIEERMTEMVQNIMKKAALSGIAESILGNWYSSLSDVTDWNAQTIAEKWKEAMALVNPMVEGMQVFANSMQAEGISLRNTAGQFTGISRDVAGASEESINGLAAGINTQNFYMSFMPLLHENVAQILTIMSGGNTVTPVPDTGIEGMPSVQKMVYDHLPYIDANINSILQLMKSVISPKSAATATHYVSVK